MIEYIYPNEARYFRESMDAGPWGVQSVLDELKPKAKAAGLWNLFLPHSDHGAGLTNLEYAPLCEMMGRSPWRPRCSIARRPIPATWKCWPATERPSKKDMAGASARRQHPFGVCHDGAGRWLPATPPTSKADILRDGDEYVINGRKWYTTGATDPRCKIIIFMGKTDPGNSDRHLQQSMVLVPKDTPGVHVLRPLPVFGYYGMPDRAGGSCLRECPRPGRQTSCWAKGAASRSPRDASGPGRIHHCMRLIGLAERAWRKCVCGPCIGSRSARPSPNRA